MYDAVSSVSARVSSFIDNNGWHFPAATSRDLQMINSNEPSYRPNLATEDSVRWMLTADRKFTDKSAWAAAALKGG